MPPPTAVAPRPGNAAPDATAGVATEGALPAALVLAALGVAWSWKLGETFEYDYDEGVYLSGAREMLHGALPFRDFFSSQPPLYPWLLRIAFAIGGDDVATGRAVSVVFALLASFAVAEIARRVVGGRVAAPVAILLCASTPFWTHMARTCQAEAPALALALAALAVVVEPRRASRPAWQIIAGVLLGLALSAKLLVAPLVAPLLWWSRGWRGRARAVAGAVAVAAALALPHGLRAVVEQAVGFHLVALQVRSDPSVLTQLRGTTAGVAVLALGGAILLRRKRREFLGVLSWIGGCAAFLVVHRPVFPHHLVLLIPALAVPAAASCAALAGRLRSRLAWLPALPVLAAAALVTAVHVRPLPPGVQEAEAMRVIADRSQPGDLVASDEQMLVYRAGRRVPLLLVDTSMVRVGTGSLTLEQVERGAKQARLVVPWTGRLMRIQGFPEWLRARCAPVLVLSPEGRGIHACR